MMGFLYLLLVMRSIHKFVAKLFFSFLSLFQYYNLRVYLYSVAQVVTPRIFTGSGIPCSLAAFKQVSVVTVRYIILIAITVYP